MGKPQEFLQQFNNIERLKDSFATKYWDARWDGDESMFKYAKYIESYKAVIVAGLTHYLDENHPITIELIQSGAMFFLVIWGQAYCFKPAIIGETKNKAEALKRSRWEYVTDFGPTNANDLTQLDNAMNTVRKGQ